MTKQRFKPRVRMQLPAGRLCRLVIVLALLPLLALPLSGQLPRENVIDLPAIAMGTGLGKPAVLQPAALEQYVAAFNRHDHTHYGQAISNNDAAAWMIANVPLFECPDAEIEEIYLFRWWTYRKHIKETPDGYVITEFLPKVSWSGKHHTISCPAGHHFREGRWIRDTRYLVDYAVFWFRKGGEPRRYSF